MGPQVVTLVLRVSANTGCVSARRSRASPACPEIWPRSFAFSSKPAAHGRASQHLGEGPVGEATCLRLRPAVEALGRLDRPRSGFEPNAVPFTPKSDQCLFPSSHSFSSSCLNNFQSVKECSVLAPIANGMKSRGRQNRRVSLGLRVTQSLEPRSAAASPARPPRWCSGHSLALGLAATSAVGACGSARTRAWSPASPGTGSPFGRPPGLTGAQEWAWASGFSGHLTDWGLITSLPFSGALIWTRQWVPSGVTRVWSQGLSLLPVMSLGPPRSPRGQAPRG